MVQNERRKTDRRQEDQCFYHSGHEAMFKDHERRLVSCHIDHSEMWNAIKSKVDFKLFVILVGLVIGNLGFQMAIYNSVKEVEKSVAVVKAEIKALDSGKVRSGK